ncbi:Rrf2 family transcriptional regulator [Prosthecochloris sp. ZM_2]|uniref:RrF2 family transcriptional regulator n=1 Tax=Prosthecochloris sp. ZM_2 TaxID=2045206 RepID=UPI000DF810B4|nr:Rrf2 family transcriptional regulator [Prosthecochloris sp. ZM_2]RNA64901.1 Rrf2 family transcriptional regulator [Prosthecochloris sp. ZM_2]
MQLLTKHTDYAIRALLTLAGHPDDYLSARRIAEEQQIPYQFLRGLLQELARAGFVSSREGAGGGVKLEKAPESISVREVIELFQGRVELSECMFRKQLCANRSNCVLRHQIMRIERLVSEEFDKVTIGSLLADLHAVNSGERKNG